MDNINLRLVKTKLFDGCTLSAFYTDKFKSEVLKLGVAMPADTDAKGTALFSLMINLLRSGTEKYPERADIVRRLGDLYDSSCSIGGFSLGENKILEISSEMLSDRFIEGESILEGICELMHQMLFCPALDENGIFFNEIVEREKNVILNKLKSLKNNSRGYASKRCRELMCEGETFGLSVTPEALADISSEEVTSYYKEFIKSLNLHFSYFGQRQPEDVAEKINKYFSSVAASESKNIILPFCTQTKEIRRFEEELNIKQGVLVIGMKTGVLPDTELSHIMSVFNNVYGGTFTSRLFKAVREKMSLCYYCSSDYINAKGLMFVSSGIDVNNRDLAEKAILNELYKLKTEYISDEELDVAKRLTLKELYDMLDYPASIASFYFTREIYGSTLTINEIIDKVKRVTKEDIKSLAKQITPDTVFFLKGTEADGYEEEGEDYE